MSCLLGNSRRVDIFVHLLGIRETSDLTQMDTDTLRSHGLARMGKTEFYTVIRRFLAAMSQLSPVRALLRMTRAS